MKKIIAMLLCVAMVAAFAVNAFAAGPFVVLPDPSTIAEYYEKAVTDAQDDAGTLFALEAYAKNLKAASKALKDAKKDLADMQKAAVDAIKVAQNYGLATAYEIAMYQFQAEVQKAIGDYYFSIVDEFVGGDWGSPAAQAYDPSTFPPVWMFVDRDIDKHYIDEPAA